MVYISSWQEFQEAAEGLYEKSPNKVRLLALLLLHWYSGGCRQTRYCVKWRGSEGKLVLKITDDTTVSTRWLCCTPQRRLKLTSNSA